MSTQTPIVPTVTKWRIFALCFNPCSIYNPPKEESQHSLTQPPKSKTWSSFRSGFRSSTFRMQQVEDCPVPPTHAVELSTPKHGDILQLDGLGGDVELFDGHKVTLKDLVSISVGGIILFIFPKADTPECAKQACHFRDSYQSLRAMGYSVYGISNDTPETNTKFRTKYNLPYALLCDQHRRLIGALGFQSPPDTTIRGVIAIDKDGKVLVSTTGSADATIEAVYPLAGTEGLPASGATTSMVM